jgi:hypothetical protein
MTSPKSAPEASWHPRLFGLNLAGGFPFTHHLGRGEGAADLSFELSPSPLVPWEDAAPVYESPVLTPEGESLARLYRLGSREVLRFPRAADFDLGSGGITCHSVEDRTLVELRFLGPVLSYWLECRGLPTLHASAVAVGGRAVGFLSNRGGGKTGLAAAFLRAGFPLLTDDVLPVEEVEGGFLARPGYPQMRMWPDEAAFFVPGWESLPTVHPAVSKRRVPVGDGGFGAFHEGALPLACLYLPERASEGTVEIQDVSPRDAVIELLRHSFSPRLVEAAGLAPQRLGFFARLAMRVPVRRLRYPSGFDRLPEVMARVGATVRSAAR